MSRARGRGDAGDSKCWRGGMIMAVSVDDREFEIFRASADNADFLRRALSSRDGDADGVIPRRHNPNLDEVVPLIDLEIFDGSGNMPLLRLQPIHRLQLSRRWEKVGYAVV